MENSIEEDIINAQHFINSIKTDKDYKDENGWHGYYNTKIVELARMLEHILSDYKRVLKENEMYKKNSEIMSKENLSTAEQLKVEIKENFRLKNQLENNRKEYQETYKDIREELKELKKENEELKAENNRLKVIKYDIDYGTESVNLIPKSTLVEINTNRYMIEIEDGKFIDLKQVYQENKTLKELHIQDNKHLDFIMKNSIPIQKVKNKIEEIGEKIKYEENEKVVIYLHKQKNILQELLESEE